MVTKSALDKSSATLKTFLLCSFGFRKDKFRKLSSRNESMKIIATALILVAVVICCTAMPKKREYARVALHHSMVVI